MAGVAINRRDLLRLTGGVVLGAGMLPALLADEARAADPAPRLTGWTDGGDKVTLGVPSTDPTQQTQQAVLMPMAGKLAAPFDAWYLWISTHDTTLLRLYSAPSPGGFFTFRGFCSVPAAPSGWDPSQVSAGDVVWDPQARVFYSTPHVKIGWNGNYQATFLMKSPDGVNWSWVKTGPIIQWGDVPSFDDNQVSYGRFLRDYAGNLHRMDDGQAVFYYRGEAIPDNRVRQIGAATSYDMLTWNKVYGEPLFDANNGQNVVPGSALQVGDTTYLVLATMDCPKPECDIPFSSTMYLKQSIGSPFQWLDGMGTPIYRHARQPTLDGGSYAIDGNRHFMAFANIPVDATKPYKVAMAYSDGDA